MTTRMCLSGFQCYWKSTPTPRCQRLPAAFAQGWPCQAPEMEFPRDVDPLTMLCHSLYVRPLPSFL